MSIIFWSGDIEIRDLPSAEDELPCSEVPSMVGYAKDASEVLPLFPDSYGGVKMLVHVRFLPDD